MRKLLHIVLFALAVTVFLSCSQEENRQTQKVMPEGQGKKYVRRKVVEVVPLHPKKIKKVSAKERSSSETFTYRTTFHQKIGEVVEEPLASIKPKTTTIGYQPDNKIETLFKEEVNADVSSFSLRIIFDNDIFDNTDYYYTNGARIELVFPFAYHSPINNILAGFREPDIGFGGFSITQNIYTPINPEATGIEYGDRPFAGYMTLGQFRESYSLMRRIYMKSALDLGVLGPASLGETVQSTVHYLEPTGWAYQIQNSFVINYYFHIEKNFLSSPYFELGAVGEAQAGTLYDKIGGGLNFRVGHFMPVYKGPLTACCISSGKREWQYWFFMTGITDFVGWDATMQGGFFDKKSPYMLANDEISRVVFRASAGVAIYYHRFGLELENFYLTPEFKGGRHFKYGRIKVVANF